ncbi:PREDICTED: uncharacterized protein LOC105462817 [Wasmannia auropunctata]|uniref:uncharacterized protein LOC105462817 n=1 Tax=Wasmannia auropunctata TaxID=64793 RepID=UPI0005ED4D97|nr:PREDICTED: uncharacterized protein LOC105462817 [Wasmannia auropunctata]
MEIILEHGSTEDDGVSISEVSLKKNLQQCDDGTDSSDASQSSDSEVHAKTAKKPQKKHKNTKSISEDSDSSLLVSKNKQKQKRFDKEKTKNVNVQPNKPSKTFYPDRVENGNSVSLSVNERETDSTEILSEQ